MQNGSMHSGPKLSDRLIRFAIHVTDNRSANSQPLRILDLRVECRNQRMSEFSVWRSAELDLIEYEAIRYGDQTPLTKVLSGQASPSVVTSDSFLPSPSLYAWV